MKEGNILYLDEINAAEADVLLRLDEALDDRRQIVLKESDGQIVKAKDSWFVIATINPLTHVGTKELPPQLLSRFPVRIRLDYPPEDVEYQIIKKHVKTPTESEVLPVPFGPIIKTNNPFSNALSIISIELFQSR